MLHLHGCRCRVVSALEGAVIMATMLLFLSTNAVSGEVASVNSGRSAYASRATMVSPPHQVFIRRAMRRG
jgi:hypothetical protein